MWLLAFVPFFMTVRFLVYRRLWTATLLDGWFMVFLLLAAVNMQSAPYPTRGLFMLARPVLGMVVVLAMVEWVRVHQQMRPVLWVMGGFGLFLGLMAIGTTQWTEKSTDFMFIIQRLPDLVPIFDFQKFVRGGFNPNEIGGALAWLTPLMFALLVYGRRSPLKFIAGVSFIILLAGVMLGQSRAAVFGVLAGMLLVAIVAFPRGRWQITALAGIAVLIAVQAGVLLNVFPIGKAPLEDAGLSNRDERTSGQRFDIWKSAFEIMRDYPLTGSGIATFRDRDVRNAYPVPNFDYATQPSSSGFSRRSIPHAHNEVFQIGVDLGVPGVFVFLGWNFVVLYMLWFCWRHGDDRARVLAVGTAAGLLAHWMYGSIDAIPLWDRFSIIYWLMIGLASAQYQQQINNGIELLKKE